MSEDSIVTIYQCQGIFEAEVVKSKLEANGIPALLKYETAGLVIGITVDGLGRVEVQVPAELAEEALDVLADTGDAEEAAAAE
ncbi:MAG: DUF2007 domain-containing protein [Anaerolineae bacterium]|jgi:hypothetical protein|nr:DUF2007 domain-containing protein [Anaerolineae bacterium]